MQGGGTVTIPKMLAYKWEPLDDQYERAREQYDTYEDWIKANHHDHGSVDRLKIISGFLAEIVLRDLLNQEPFESGTKDPGWDVELGGLKLDVKQVSSLLYIDERQLGETRECDGYIFTIHDNANTTLYILGWIPKDMFLDVSTRVQKGEVMRQRAGHTHTSSVACRVLQPWELLPMQGLEGWPLKRRTRLPEHLVPQSLSTL